MQQAVEGLEEQVKDKDGTIETLQRQLVQAGIRDKVRTVESEIRKGATKAQGKMALTADRAEAEADVQKQKAQLELQKDKQSRGKNGTRE